MSKERAHFSLARAVFAEDLSGDLEHLASDLECVAQSNRSGILTNTKETQNTAKAQIIDIRSSQDFAKKHIKGAKNITDFESLSREILSHQHTNFLLHCYSGYTVAMIGSELVQMGANNVFYFDESFETLCEKLESTQKIATK